MNTTPECGNLGKEVTLDIESVAYRGFGVARLDGIVHFVPETCPGERVKAIITAEHKNYLTATVTEVIKASPIRAASPDCRVRNYLNLVKTPGCVYDHLTHAGELELKKSQLLSFLERQAQIPNAAEILRDSVESPETLHYRNKAVMHSARQQSGRQVLGYIGDDNQTVIDIPQCPLSAEQINSELQNIRADNAFWRYVGAGSEVTLRWTENDGVAIYVDRPDHKDRQNLPPLTENTPILGHIRVPARGFYQMNPEVGGLLVSAVMEELQKTSPARFIDFYCGVGVFGLSAAKLGINRVVGLDSGTDVIRTAGANARHFALHNRARFECHDVARSARHILAENGGPGAMVIVDPPRAGLDNKVVDALISIPSHTLVYVSCAPDTLSRDLKALTSSGVYTLESAQLFHMFPRTAHFETLCVLRH